MAKVTICDQPNCGKVIDEKLTDFNLKTDDVLVTVSLLGEKDRCAACTRKLQAKYLKEAWGQVKQKRKPKPALKVAA